VTSAHTHAQAHARTRSDDVLAEGMDAYPFALVPLEVQENGWLEELSTSLWYTGSDSLEIDISDLRQAASVGWVPASQP